MRAAIVNEPGGPEALVIEEREIPEPREGWVLVRVHAFGLNRAELTTRSGGSGDAVRFPRVIGIECAGEVVAAPDGELAEGQTVVAVMGGMGREFDGGYQQYALLPKDSVFPVRTDLSWERLGAVPESFATAYGSVVRTLALGRGERLLIRGGSSSVGMAAIAIASELGAEVIATTRQESKRDTLIGQGASLVLIDEGGVASAVRDLVPDGVDALFELVGPTAFADSVGAVREGGRTCISGFLEHDWDVDPARSAARSAGVTFGRFGSIEVTRPAWDGVMQAIVDRVGDGRYGDGLARTFELDRVADAHRAMEANEVAGKIVVLTGAG